MEEEEGRREGWGEGEEDEYKKEEDEGRKENQDRS
jgi:hypothetical protein